MKLEGRVALVTGAGHRIGRAIALALGEAGCRVAVHYRSSREPADQTARRIADGGGEALTIQADLAEAEQITALFEDVRQGYGELDILVNSAASFERTPFDEITCEAWDGVMAVNLRAPFLCSQAAARLMQSPGRATEKRGTDEGAPDSRGPGVPGLIVNVSDISALTTWRGYAHHGVSKAGLLHLTKVAARELGPHVRVNAVVPGPILPPPGEDEESQAWRRRGERLPLRRTGRPEDVGEAVVFLASNDFITGETIVIDGGERLLAGGR